MNSNKEMNVYRISLDVDFGKDLYIKASSPYEALSRLKELFLNSNVINFDSDDIYNLHMSASEADDDRTLCEFDASVLCDGIFAVDMEIDSETFRGKCDLYSNFFDVVNIENHIKKDKFI